VLQIQGTDYDVNAIEADDIGFTGGSVVMVEAVTSARVSLIRSTPIVRETDFPRGSSLSIDVLNRDFDKLTAIAQELAYQIDRAIRLPPTDSTSPGLFLPGTAAERAGLVLGFDETGDNIAMVTPSEDILVVSDASKVPLARTISAGTGLTGGGNLSADRSFALAPSGVTAGTFTFANVTVDTYGRVTAAASNAGSGGGVPTSRAITVASPLSGGGTLVSDVNIGLADSGVAAGAYTNATLTVSAKGIVTAIASNPSGVAVTQTRTLTAGAGLAGGGDLSADRSFALSTTGVVAGSYASADITIDAYGRITAAAAGSGAGGYADWINVQAHGAIGDGSTNDTTAVVAAIAALPAGGGVIYFPPGVYRVVSALEVADKSVVFLGGGVDVAKIKFDGAANGILFTDSAGSSSNDRATLTVSGLTLSTTAAGGGKAISADFTGSSGILASVESVRVYNTAIRGEDAYAGSPADYWDYGIYMDDASSVFIDGVHILAGTGSDAGTAGIYITRSASDNSQNFRISNIYIERMGTGIKLDHSGTSKTIEGVYINNGELVGNNIGIHMRTTGGTGGEIGTVVIAGMHINARTHAIYANDFVNGVVVNGCELRLQNNGGSWVDNTDVVKVQGGYSFQITGCYIIGGTSSGHPHNGVAAVSTNQNVLITGCSFNDLSNGILIATAAGGQVMTTGNLFSGCTTKIADDKAQAGEHNNSFRGILVYRTDNATIDGGVITWQGESYDTDGFWSSGTQITVPSGVGIRRVRVTAATTITGITAGNQVIGVIQKNGSGVYTGRGSARSYSSAGDATFTITTAIITVSDGDYFDLLMNTTSGGSVSGGKTWLALEVIH
jgi:hypothetical protein